MLFAKLYQTGKRAYLCRMQIYSKEALAYYPDGTSSDYQQALKKAQFWDMLKNGEIRDGKTIIALQAYFLSERI